MLPLLLLLVILLLTDFRENSWTLFVRSKCGGLICLKHLNSSATCQHLYTMITTRTGIPMRAIFLFKENNFLNPSDTLAESGLVNYSVIELYTPQLGGGKGEYYILHIFRL